MPTLPARNGSQVFDVQKVALRRYVLSYSSAVDCWDGPFALLHEESEDFIVPMDHYLFTFRATSVKPFISTAHSLAASLTSDKSPWQPPSYPPLFNPTYRLDHNPLPPATFLLMSSCKRRARFLLCRVEQLVDRGVEIVPFAENIGYRIFGKRFVDEIKSFGSANAFDKSLSVTLGITDKNNDLLTNT